MSGKKTQIDISNPDCVDRQRAENFFDVYANHIDILATHCDVVLGFVQMGEHVKGKAVMTERGRVTMTYSKAVELKNALIRVLKESEEMNDGE